MKTKWILQTNIFKEKAVQRMIDCFERLNLLWEAVTIIPFSDTIPKIEPYEGPIVAYGTTTLMRNLDRAQCWFPGMWYNAETFRPSIWGNKLEYIWLNRDSKFFILEDFHQIKEYFKEHGIVFMRPDSDLKLFDGGVFDFYEFESWYKRLEINIETQTYKNLSKDTVVLLSPKKNIIREWRCVIIDKHVVAWSLYKANGALFTSSSPLHNNPEVSYMANHIAKKDWQLSKAYVVDICETKNNDIYMIELNTFNASGFYDCDITSIVHHASKLAEKQWQMKMS
ncbi:MAG TPA: ATP-grasp domain-containing protein [Candidatus Glassbacteria bacterium]|nr:ATP-grasp domain-containing protein [Candidatus Glassbacteria bacterium]